MAAANIVNTSALVTTGTTRPVQERKPRISGMRVVPDSLEPSKLWNLGSDNGYGITSDSSGNVYVTGSTVGALDGNTSAGGYDLFVVKYNSSGVKQWTQQLGASSTDIANSITIDSSGIFMLRGLTVIMAQHQCWSGSLDGNTSAGLSDLFQLDFC